MMISMNFEIIKAKKIQVIMEGDGNPANDHQIKGLIFLDGEGKFISSMGVGSVVHIDSFDKHVIKV